MMKNKKAIGVSVFFVLLICQPAVAQVNVILGVLEDTPGDAFGQPNVRDVRVIFKKIGDRWQPYQADCRDQECLGKAPAGFPQEVTWTIAFDGRNLGQITSRAPGKFTMYSRIGQQVITSKMPVPTVGKEAVEFGGFLDARVYRPLIAVSQPNFRDPDVWKPVVLNSPAAITGLHKAFRTTFPKLCSIPQNETDTPPPFDYHEEDIKLVKSYASKSGWDLAEMHIDAMLCDDTEAGFGLYDSWFAVDPAGSAHYLGSGMWLVDAGDYDSDGKSELVFSINSDNRGGYRIYYDDFKKSAEFEFSYH